MTTHEQAARNEHRLDWYFKQRSGMLVERCFRIFRKYFEVVFERLQRQIHVFINDLPIGVRLTNKDRIPACIDRCCSKPWVGRKNSVDVNAEEFFSNFLRDLKYPPGVSLIRAHQHFDVYDQKLNVGKKPLESCCVQLPLSQNPFLLADMIRGRNVQGHYCCCEGGYCSYPTYGAWVQQDVPEAFKVGARKKEYEKGDAISRNPRAPLDVPSLRASAPLTHLFHSDDLLFVLCVGNLTETEGASA